MENVENNRVSKCGFGAESVAYIYGELPSAEAVAYERHLAVCEKCIDDLAAISLARFEVFDYRAKEFAPLRAPHFAIDFAAGKPAGLLARLAAAFPPAPAWAPAAGVIVLSLGAAFALLNTGSNDVAEVQSASHTVAPVQAEATLTTPIVVEEPVAPRPAVSGKRIFGVSRVSIAAAPTTDRRGKSTRSVTRSRPAAAQLARTDAQVPRLTQSEFEDDDVTLRLADILDPVGGD